MRGMSPVICRRERCGGWKRGCGSPVRGFLCRLRALRRAEEGVRIRSRDAHAEKRTAPRSAYTKEPMGPVITTANGTRR